MRHAANTGDPMVDHFRKLWVWYNALQLERVVLPSDRRRAIKRMRKAAERYGLRMVWRSGADYWNKWSFERA